MVVGGGVVVCVGGVVVCVGGVVVCVGGVVMFGKNLLQVKVGKFEVFLFFVARRQQTIVFQHHLVLVVLDVFDRGSRFFHNSGKGSG